MQFTKATIKSYIQNRYTINEASGCWEWNLTTDRGGYARMNYKENGKWKVLTGLHRHVFLAYNGKLLKSTPVVRHTCNNPSCINPAHLIRGTHKDNVDDSIAANTHASLHQNEVRRLTPDERNQVYTLLHQGESMYSIAKMFNSSTSNIFMYKHRLHKWLAKQPTLTTDIQVTITETLTIKEGQ